MSSKSRSATPPSKKRLLYELQAQTREPAPFLVSVGPVSDHEILTWEAVMKGVPGTAYEGIVFRPREASLSTVLMHDVQPGFGSC